jgi:hypothetical protein
MESNVSFLAKVVLVSALISVAIKLLGPMVPIAASPRTAWLLVLLPSGVMATLLGWRAWQQRSLD